jgi:hypothetical protein
VIIGSESITPDERKKRRHIGKTFHPGPCAIGHKLLELEGQSTIQSIKICKKFKKGKNYVTANTLKMEEEATKQSNGKTSKKEEKKIKNTK